MIKLENVNKYFGDLHVLKDVNLEAKEGEKLVFGGTKWRACVYRRGRIDSQE